MEPTTSVTHPTRSSMHPVMIIAAVAVVLFCGVGSAALLGWLPSSSAGIQPAGLSAQQPPVAMLASNDMGRSPSMGMQMAPGPVAATNTLAMQQQPQQQQPQYEPVSQQVRDNAPAARCTSCGVIESVREVRSRAQGSGVGAAGGAVLGGLLGNQVGSGHGRQLATVAGAIGGAVAGNQIEGNMNAHVSYTILVRMDNGSTRTFHQSARPNWNSGDPVRIVHNQLRSNR